MTTLLQDLRYGTRSLLKTPGLALTAVAALALGIGANTAIFSVVDAVLLRPMPYARPEHLLMLWQNDTNRSVPREWVSPANFLDWKRDTRTFESLAAFRDRSYDLTGSAEPERIDGQWVSASLFPTLGVKPLYGRVFLEEEDRPGAAQVAVLSHRLWQRRFGSDPGIVGKPITLNGQSVTVVGIMPPGFRFPGSDDELWMPLAFDDQMAGLRHSLMLRVVGRLAPGATVAQARAEMDTIGGRLEKAYPDANTGMGITLIPLQEEMVGEVRTALLILLGAVAFVLLIACANVANLLLSRAAARHKEMAIRASLGAGRARLLRQLLTESVMLSLVGGVLGALLALWGVDLLQLSIPADVPRFRPIVVDARVLLFTLGVSVLTGLLFGVLPALDSSRLDLNEALRDGTRGTPGRARGRARDLLVVGEIGVAFVLLIGAGLLIRSFGRIRELDPGFRTDRVLTLRMGIPRAKYGELPKRMAFYRQLLDRVGALPGVRSSGLISFLPLTFTGGSYSYTIEGRPPAPSGQEPFAVYRLVSSDLLRSLGVPLRRGRGFTEQDDEKAPRVAIISESLARRDFPGEDPIGRRIALGVGGPEDELLLIVGIAGDVRHFELDRDPRPALYVPYAQESEFWLAPHDLVVRAQADPLALAAAVREAIRSIDPEQTVSNVRTMEAVMSEAVARRRFSTLLLGAFAGVAVLLAALGTYGVIAHSVARRTQEIGIRMALGARPIDVLRMVLGQGTRLAILGAVLGVVCALALTRLMGSLLFGVSPTDPMTFFLTALVLPAIAVLASFVPARRATRVDPMIALRCE